MKPHISLAAAITLTGWSERTFWRRFADGSVDRHVDGEKNGKSMIVLDSILPHLSIPLTPEDVQLLLDADNGSAQAQSDMALLFLANAKPREAVYWLELAIKQGDASAMHWLGRAYVDGTGVPKDENLGLMWIAKAAAAGHVVSQAQMAGMINSVTSKPSY
jgi:TPR repeat protein